VLHEPRDRTSVRLQLDRAWERFVTHGELDGVRPEIARSWTRTRDIYGIDPGLRRAPLLSRDDLSRRCELDDTFEVARPVLEQFSAGLRGAGHVVAYLDASGSLLSLGGDHAAVDGLAEINFCPGASWREESTGTNGPGTALAERRPTEVFASEHFVRAWQDWTSAAAPIGAPGSGEPVAVVDVTGPWDARDPQGLVAATAMAAVIEERLRARRSVRGEIIRYAMRAARACGDALIAVDERGRVLQVNDAAARAVVLEEGQLPGAVRERLLAAFRGDAPPDDEVALEWPGPGADRRRVVCSIARHDRRPIGAVLRVVIAPGPRAGRGGPAGRQLAAARPFEAILGGSERLGAALHLAQVSARNDLPVVLYGETGTGKELFAQGIHAASARSAAPLVALNCGAIPASLIEAELFGYEPGTFTGGQREGRAGKLEEASGGTLFLDEVSELPPQAQTALLRVLQESEVVRLGGSRARPVDVRIIAATNRRLDDEVAAGRFRHDLFFRLNVLTLVIPPLRDRPEDVPLLARAFLSEAEDRTGRSGLSLSDATLEVLAGHRWAGNVRELKNVVMRAAAVVVTPPIQPTDLLLVDLGGAAAKERPGSCALRCQPDPALPCQQGMGAKCDPAAPARRGEPIEAPEADGPGRDRLVEVLDASGWNIARTATSLGVSRMTLYRRLRKYGITR
jgi:sigma-54 dependent transcriptional regulator, acetoin dehydrogenase operon transcriptional activator AcoR